jgi:competence protein ComEC
MKHAAVRALAGVAVGISLSQVAVLPWWAGAVLIAAGLGLARLTRGLTLLLVLAGAAFLCSRTYRVARPDPRLYEQTAFTGTVIDEPDMGEHPRVTVRLDPPWAGRVTVWLRDTGLGLRYGDAVRVEERVRALDFPRNPGLIDFNAVLQRRGFVGTCAAGAGSVSILGRGQGPFLMARLFAPARRYILGSIARHLPGAEGALLRGLLLGGSTGLPEDVKQAFNDAGIIHILAVSGMNVGVVVGVIWLVLSLLGVRGWWRFGLGVAGALCYVTLVGWTAAPARAGLMACAALLASPLQRRVTPLATLSTAGIVLLLLDPHSLFDAGAQLSFAATAGIIAAAGLLEKWRAATVLERQVKNNVIVPLAVSAAATIATAPLLLHHFARVQPLAFLTSLAVVLLVGLAMPLGIVMLVSGLLSHWLAGVFAQALWLALAVLLKLTMVMGRLDWAIVEPGRLSWPWVAWLYALLAAAMAFRHRYARTAFVLLLLAGLGVASWVQALRPVPNTVTFLDPGQGDALLFEDSLGRRVLFDAGLDGPGVLRDYLRARGIHELDAVVVTHPDRDHYGGLLDMDGRCRIRVLLVPTAASTDSTYRGLLRRLSQEGTAVREVSKGDSLTGFAFEVKFLWPDAATVAQYRVGRARTNDLSVVARVTHRGFTMLLTGDLDDPDLIAAESLKAQLLKSPHHGSRKGNPPGLFDLVRPEHVVAMGRFPTPAGLEQKFGGGPVDYVNTRRDGAAVVRFGPGGPVFQRPFGANLR